MKNKCITFIGAGHMAGSLIHGLVKAGYPAEYIWATDPSAERLNTLKTTYGIYATTFNKEGGQQGEIIVLAVKPQDAKEALASLKTVIEEKSPLIISVITGWSVDRLQTELGKKELAIVRCVPNTPALIGNGATGLYANRHCLEEQRKFADSLFQTVSMTVWLEDESLMNAVTALSGSGPAYFFAVIEAIQNAGRMLGLPNEIAKALTLQTAFGATKMALESEEEVAMLRAQVTSKGGTTERALDVLEKKNLNAIFLSAVSAAFEQAKALSLHDE